MFLTKFMFFNIYTVIKNWIIYPYFLLIGCYFIDFHYGVQSR